jgi:plastocyanin
MKLFYIGHVKISILACLFILSLSLGCKKSDPVTNTAPPASTGTSNEVSILNKAFTSNAITVSVNTTVKWTNNDAFDHTVTSTSGLFDSKAIPAGGVYTHQFTTAGTFPYQCMIHTTMTGSVTVK